MNKDAACGWCKKFTNACERKKQICSDVILSKTWREILGYQIPLTLLKIPKTLFYFKVLGILIQPCFMQTFIRKTYLEKLRVL